MKIAVCVKVVPDGPLRLDPATRRLERPAGALALSRLDAPALEAALRLREAGTEAELVVVTVAPEAAGEALLKALALGADRAVLVADEAIAGSDLLATSRVLAAALAREQADLVVFGQQGAESDGALLWAAVAERLRLPVVSQATAIQLDDGHVRVRRQTELGLETVEAPLPAVVGVVDAGTERRYPSLKGIMGAKAKPQELLRLADLGLAAAAVGDAGSQTAVLGIAPSPPRAEARTLEDDGTAAEQILAFLRERSLA